MSEFEYKMPSYDEIRELEAQAAVLRAVTIRNGLRSVAQWFAAPFAALRHA